MRASRSQQQARAAAAAPRRVQGGVHSMEGLLKRKRARGVLGDRWEDRFFVLSAAACTLRFFAGGSAEGEPEGEAIVVSFSAREELQASKDELEATKSQLNHVVEDKKVVSTFSGFLKHKIEQAKQAMKPLSLPMSLSNPTPLTAPHASV